MACPTPLLEKVRNKENAYPSLSLSPIDKFRDGILRMGNIMEVGTAGKEATSHL